MTRRDQQEWLKLPHLSDGHLSELVESQDALHSEVPSGCEKHEAARISDVEF